MGAPFEISEKDLDRIYGIWGGPAPRERLLLFAFRGCLPSARPAGWRTRIALETASPDYRHLRCTLGIWDRVAGKVFAVPGSTVPHEENVLKSAAQPGPQKGKGTNQMEPGFYGDLRKGEHLMGKPGGHSALRQTGYRFYRRSHHPPPYTRRDPLYFGNPYDNLHCAWNLDGRESGFRSSGCLVVAGLPHCPRIPDSGQNRGPWEKFHRLIYGAGQRGFPILLLRGAEAAKALGEGKPEPRLCYGSRSATVQELQSELKRRGLYLGAVDGILGPRTYRAWNRAGLSGYGDPV